MRKLTAVDLFSGAGGLSLGFKQTELVNTIIAIENNKNAQKTYERNNSEVEFYDDITRVDFLNIKEKLMKKNIEVDLVIGGPPCQGFSNANRQKHDLISANNQLVKEYLRAIEQLNPKAFVMENVKSMGSKKHKFFYNKNDNDMIEKLNIKLTREEYVLAKKNEYSEELILFLKESTNLKKYCLKKEVFFKLLTILRNTENHVDLHKYLIKNLKSINSLLDSWDKQHNTWSLNYQKLWTETKLSVNTFIEKNVDFDIVVKNIKSIVEIQKVLSKMQEVFDQNIEVEEVMIRDGNIAIIVKTYNVLDYVLAKLSDLNYVLDKGVLNAAQFGVPQERERLFVMGVKKEFVKSGCKVALPIGFLNKKSRYYTIGQAIRDLEKTDPETDVQTGPLNKSDTLSNHPLSRYFGTSDLIYNHIMTKTRETALNRFKKLNQGENFHSLKDEDKSTYTNPKRTQNTIYQRLNYEVPSGTVLNVRKSMWVHPIIDRAISIREAARLQSFPDDFIFEGTKDSQYQQVGNAVPPLLGRAVAEKLLESMGIFVKKTLKEELELDEDVEVQMILAI